MGRLKKPLLASRTKSTTFWGLPAAQLAPRFVDHAKGVIGTYRTCVGVKLRRELAKR